MANQGHSTPQHQQGRQCSHDCRSSSFLPLVFTVTVVKMEMPAAEVSESAKYKTTIQVWHSELAVKGPIYKDSKDCWVSFPTRQMLTRVCVVGRPVPTKLKHRKLDHQPYIFNQCPNFFNSDGKIWRLAVILCVIYRHITNSHATLSIRTWKPPAVDSPLALWVLTARWKANDWRHCSTSGSSTGHSGMHEDCTLWDFLLLSWLLPGSTSKLQ